MIDVKVFSNKDRETVMGWWARLGLDPKNIDYPNGTSFMASKNGTPLYAVALQLVNGGKVAYIDGFIRNPDEASDADVVNKLHEDIIRFAKIFKYEKFLTITSYPEVMKRDTELGYSFYPERFYFGVKEI